VDTLVHVDAVQELGRREENTILAPILRQVNLLAFTHPRCYRAGMVHSNENVTEGTMLAEERMTVDERGKHLRRMQKRYGPANRLGRGKLLDEMQQVLGLHRLQATSLPKTFP
jgi:hypothetical protein